MKEVKLNRIDADNVECNGYWIETGRAGYAVMYKSEYVNFIGIWPAAVFCMASDDAKREYIRKAARKA